MRTVAFLAAGGAAGTFLRHFLSTRLPAGALPWGTFGANMAGCFLVGLLEARIGRGSLAPESRALLVTGFCGALTTFSTLMLEASHMHGVGAFSKSVLYLLLSLALGLLFLRLGGAFGHAL